MVTRLFNQHLCFAPMLAGARRMTLRQREAGGFQMAIRQVQAHLAAFGNGEGFGQIGVRPLPFPRYPRPRRTRQQAAWEMMNCPGLTQPVHGVV